MKLSIVSTLYASSVHVLEFLNRMSTVARSVVGDDFEIILVNDGSPDDSLEVALSQIELFPQLTIIDLSRNFGHHPAMMTGLGEASGDRVFLIDSDLEEQPEWLAEFSEKLERETADVVFGVQASRKGGWFERISGAIYHSIFNSLTGLQQTPNFVTARLMTRRYVDALLLHRERELNIGGLLHITGFKQIGQPVTKLSISPTSYSLSKRVSHLVNGITSFSHKPLYFVFYIGLTLFITSLLFLGLLLTQYLFLSRPPEGYVSVIASIWFFSGLLILFSGLQGIYMAKIFSEVKGRPRTIVRHVYRRGSSK